MTRAMLHHVAGKETAGAHLLTMHNLRFVVELMDEAREAVARDEFPRFLREWFGAWFGRHEGAVPGWVVDALRDVGVDLLADEAYLGL